eukprot:TRINITY_DN2759_c0_g1_i1.p1 TRINITY_DN2759_c0_g1~~TRINITY_DN2759_c0_g1_i1.p1  ORF type:complete len:170 (-),score=12.47 TRINITY_DN2759_c0_g1_i1:48-557(-)
MLYLNRLLYVPVRGFQTSSVLAKIKAGRYKVTLDRNRPLTYEMAMIPEKIGTHKSFNSFNTGQLEGEFRYKNQHKRGGTLLSHKLFMEDMFIRKFLKGTWAELFVSEIIVKRQYNTVRIAGIISRKLQPRKMYFLIGYSEEMLSFWLKCPVKLELQVVNDPKDVIFKYI